MKSVAVVLLNYNGLHWLKKFLGYIVENSPEADVVLIDNFSKDESVAWFKSQYPQLQCIELEENLGYAGGYNAGLKNLKNPYYALLNTDLRVTKNWLTPLLKEFESQDNTAILQPHILNQNKTSHFEYAGAAGGYLDRFGFPFCRGRILNTIEEDHGQYDQTQDIFWASGACFLIRNDVFWKLGGFDAAFFAHQEEIDLCWRAFNLGYQVKAIGTVKVYHVGGGTLAPSSMKVYLNHRNSLFMLVKNLPKQDQFYILFIRLFLDGLIGLSYLLRLKPIYTWAIIRAHISFYNSIKSMKEKSKGSPRKSHYFLIKSILFQYLIKRVLIFSRLYKKN